MNNDLAALLKKWSYLDCYWFAQDQGEKAHRTHVREHFSTQVSGKAVMS